MMKYVQLLPVILLFAACGQLDDHQQDGDDAHDPAMVDDGHDHGEAEPLAFTLYTDRTELFVEFKPLVFGEESRFAAHFTHMGKLFTPITEGSVTVELRSDGPTTKASVDGPSSPGIFRLAITPEQIGAAQLVFMLNSKDKSDTIVIDDLQVYADVHEAAHVKRAVSEGDITYLKEQAWKIPFALEKVESTAFASSVRVGAEVEPAISGEQVIAARSAGVVHLLGDAVLEGKAVKKGQALFRLSSQGVIDGNAGAAMQQARNDLDHAKAELQRVEALYADRLVTQEELLLTRNAFANAESMVQQTSSAQTVTSNISGYVRSLQVREGQFVQPGDVLATIATNERLSIHADVPVRAFEELGSVDDARIRKQDGTVFTLKQLNGKVQSIGRAADGLYVPVRLEVDGTSGLLPGSMVEVWLKSTKKNEALTIALSAILEQEGQTYCYVQTAGESMDKRTIKLGPNDGLRSEVLDGLRLGERVVRVGAMDVKLATASGAIPEHGHEH